MSDRVMDLLMVRCAGKSEGWAFPADSAAGHIATIDKPFRKARAQAGLPAGLKLYCARHDYGTQMLQQTGNLALVMRAMGQTSTEAAMQYQHHHADRYVSDPTTAPEGTNANSELLRDGSPIHVTVS